MDRPLKPPQDLADIARSLLSPVPELEGKRTQGQTATQALSLLGTLENVARESFTQAQPPKATLPDAKATAREEARAALERALRGRHPSSPALAPPPPTVFSSKHPHYQGALQDRQVIEALLDFHRKSRDPSTERKSHSAFILPDHPRIDAQPKPRTLSTRRTPGVAYPVLRPPRGKA